MTKVFLPLDKLSECATQATQKTISVNVRKVFKWWCADLVRKYCGEKELMEELRKGASENFWEWLTSEQDKQNSWSKLLYYLKKCDCTLAQFFVKHLPMVSAINTMEIRKNVEPFQVSPFQPFMCFPPVNIPIAFQADIAYRSVPVAEPEPDETLGKRKRENPEWNEMNRQQRADFLIGKIVENKKIKSNTPIYQHMNNVVKGNRNGKRHLIKEEKILIEVLDMTSKEREVLSILAKF